MVNRGKNVLTRYECTGSGNYRCRRKNTEHTMFTVQSIFLYAIISINILHVNDKTSLNHIIIANRTVDILLVNHFANV